MSDRASELAYWAKEGTTNVGRCMAVDDLLRMVRDLEAELGRLERLVDVSGYRSDGQAETIAAGPWPGENEL